MRTEIFNERIIAAQGAKHVIAQSAQKKSLREELENEVEKFLARGGSVKPLSGIDFKPKQPSKRVERINPWREKEIAKTQKYAHYKGNVELRNWCKAKQGRIAQLAKVLNVTPNYISQRTFGTSCVTQMEFKDTYLVAMKSVEKLEKQASESGVAA
ncbi:hypothetical protein ACX1N5_04025 [Acinetobacter sp. ANC 4636]